MSVATIVGKQNPDGGWPYVRGGSWTEPTVHAVMALLASGEKQAASRGLDWIRRVGRADGGWPARAGIDQSTWTTGLVALLPPGEVGSGMHERAIAWLLGKQGRETTLVYRLREWMLGATTPRDQAFTGWPWVPDTAAWVGPTAIAILALQKEEGRRPSSAAAARIREGQEFLLARMCKGGGWNHGASNALGYAAHAYPETTGMALAALRGVEEGKVNESIGRALEFLRDCRSADALNWLRIGLRAHDRLPADVRPNIVSPRTVAEAALAVLVDGGAYGELV